MVQRIAFILLIAFSNALSAKEWKNLRTYQSETKKQSLECSDWLKSDRIHNTCVWQHANTFNLENNLPKEYKNIVERRDFYKWISTEIENLGHEVVWFKMVYFISKKLHLMETFPNTVFANKKIMQYANSCNETIFNNAFIEVDYLFKMVQPLYENKALQWDEDMLYKEQYVWVDSIINTIEAKNVNKIEHILQGKFLYSLLVPKEIRFNGNLYNKEERYHYAINKLRPYCKKANN